MLRATRNDDLLTCIDQLVLAPQFFDDGVLQVVGSARVRVLGKPRMQGGNGGLLDVFRGIEIRLATAKIHDITALSA
jgi:hypothetical protein